MSILKENVILLTVNSPDTRCTAEACNLIPRPEIFEKECIGKQFKHHWEMKN
jgi:hypothetical protein